MENKPQFIAVLRRAIPVENYGTDTLTHIVRTGETVESVMEWATKACAGQTVMISLEIVHAE